MSGLALICSGQGSQTADMLDFAASHDTGRAVLQAFSAALGRDLLSAFGSGETLTRNSVAQPLAVASALANWAVLQPWLPTPQCVAGYSVGEVSAWACAGAWSAPQAAAVCLERAAAMDRAAPPDSGMLAVRGLPVAQMLERAGEAGVHIAIVNEDDHVVLGGTAPALLRAAQRLGAAGAWTKMLEVEVPSHTPLLAPAAEEFGHWLRAQPASAPSTPVIMGIDGTTTLDTQRGLAALARAIAEPILWQDCMQQLVDSGVRAVLELGPGRNLSSMFQQVHPQLPARAVSDFRTAQGVATWVHRQLE